MRAFRHLFFDIDRQLEDATRAKQQLEAERWRKELRPGAMRLFAARTTKLRWSRALLESLIEELYLDDPTDRTQSGLFRGFILRNSDVGAAALTLDVFLFRRVCGNHIIWGFQHVAGFRRRHIGASIQDAWTTSLNDVRTALDADTAADRTRLQRAMTQEIGPTREAVVDLAVQRLDVSQKQATEAYSLAHQFETSPRSVWGFVQGLTRLSQRTPWQDGRFALDRAASRLLTTVH